MKAVSDNVIIQYTKDERKTSGGIVLTGAAMSTPNDTIHATVLSVGSKVVNIGIGNSVVVEKFSVVELNTVDGVVTATVKGNSILAIVM